MSEKLLNDCRTSIKEFTRNLIRKLNDPTLHIQLNPGKIHAVISSFMQSDPSKNQKMQLNFIFRQEIKSYLRSGSASRLKDLQSIKDAQIFLQIIGDFWANFQRFTFGLQFICSQANTFFVSAAKYLQKMSGGKYQLGAIPIIAVNELKQYMEKMNLTSRFTKVFCDFVANQRLGKNVPRQLVKQGIQFFQSNYHDYDAVCHKVGERVLILKKINHDAPPHRHSSADKFFKKFIISELLQSCRDFYTKFTTQKSGSMNATEQVLQMIKFIEEQETRATFYIHQDKNVDQYMKCIYEKLIQLNLPQRINKPTGLSKYFSQYNHTKPDYQEQIKNFWKIYSRVFNNAKKHIIDIYTIYFEQEGKNIINLMEKPPQFINSVINLNKKNLSIVNMLGGMLEFDRIRVQSIQKILSCQMVKGSKFQGKYFLGAKHLSAILHQKIRTKYAKQQKYGQDQIDLMNIFKILKYKTIAIKQLTKFLNSRLLQQIDMSKDAQYINSMSLQTRIIQQIKKESSQNDVKNLQQCLKDITKSQQMTNKLKQSQIGKKHHFLNQIIIKNNTFWNQSTFFDIQPPNVLRNCISQTVNYIQKNANIQFQLFNGVSTLRSTMNKGKYTFQIKNIYVVILLHIDQKSNKKLFYGDIIDKIKPTGRMKEKAYLQLSRYLIQLTNFGLLKSNKSLNKDSPNLQTCQGSDFFQINRDFAPPKKVAIIKTPMITALPQHIKKAFAIKSKSLDQDEKQYEKDRKVYVEAICVKQLKHAHHNGEGTVTFDELLQHFQQGRARELNVNAKYLKQTVEVLINKKYCQRVEGKKNTLKYIA